MSEQPEAEGPVVVQRALTHPFISIQADGNGIIHLCVGNGEDGEPPSMVEDFLLVPQTATQIGDALFKVGTSALPLYAAWLERQQSDGE